MVEVNTLTEIQELNQYFAEATSKNLSHFANHPELWPFEPVLDPNPCTIADVLPPSEGAGEKS